LTPSYPKVRGNRERIKTMERVRTMAPGEHFAPTLACRLGDAAFAARERVLTDSSFAHSGAVEDRPVGNAFRFPAADPRGQRVQDVVLFGRTCCPIFRFEIEAAPDGAPCWFGLGGPGRAKRFMDEASRLPIDAATAGRGEHR